MGLAFPRTMAYLALGFTVSFVRLAHAAEAQSDLIVGKRAYEQKDYPTALKRLTPLAEQNISEAQVLLGILSLKGLGTTRDIQRALKWFQAAADLGNVEGQFYFGSMNLMGAGIDHNTAEGMKWLRLSAEHGSSDAQVLLGLVYLQGHDGIPRDLVQADAWFLLAARGEDPLAPKQVELVEKQMTASQIEAAHHLATKLGALHGS